MLNYYLINLQLKKFSQRKEEKKRKNSSWRKLIGISREITLDWYDTSQRIIWTLAVNDQLLIISIKNWGKNIVDILIS